MNTPRPRGRIRKDGTKINSPNNELNQNPMPPTPTVQNTMQYQDKSVTSNQNTQTPLLIKIKVPNNIKISTSPTNKLMQIEEEPTTPSKNKNIRKYKKHKNNLESNKDEYIEEDAYFSDEEEKKTSRTKNKNRTRNKNKRNINTRSRPRKNEEEESLYGDEDQHTQAYYAAIAMWKKVEECFEVFTQDDYNFLNLSLSYDDDIFKIPKLGTSWRIQRRSEIYSREYPKTYLQKMLAAMIDDRSQHSEKKEELEFIENYIKQSLISLGLLDDQTLSMDHLQMNNGPMMQDNINGEKNDSEDDEICLELKKLQEKLRAVVEENRKIKEKLLQRIDEENELRKIAKAKKEKMSKEETHYTQILKSYSRSKKKKKT